MFLRIGKNHVRLIILALVVGLCAWQAFSFFTGERSRALYENEKGISEQAQQLIGLHSEMGATQSGHWLESHHESGQTFQNYLSNSHLSLTEERNVLYVVPLGDFNELQKEIVDLSAEFLGLYFMCEVTVMDPLGLDTIPRNACRVHPKWGVRQIHSKYVLDELLPPLVPEDAFATIAFSSSDLYPADDWNFVYGQASLSGRVGVWSLFRNGDPRTEFKTVLTRTLKTATHETGHMFTIKHCIAYSCNMCGSNNMSESDRRPLFMCPECLPKVLLATDCDAVERFKLLKAFCERNQLDETAEYYANCLNILD